MPTTVEEVAIKCEEREEGRATQRDWINTSDKKGSSDVSCSGEAATRGTCGRGRSRVTSTKLRGRMPTTEEQNNGAPRLRGPIKAAVVATLTIMTAVPLVVVAWTLASMFVGATAIRGSDVTNCPDHLCRVVWDNLSDEEVRTEAMAEEAQTADNLGCVCWDMNKQRTGSRRRRPVILAILRRKKAAEASDQLERSVWMPTRNLKVPGSARPGAAGLPRVCKLKGKEATNTEITCNREKGRKGENPNLCIYLSGAKMRMCTQVLWQKPTWKKTWGGWTRTEPMEDSGMIDQEFEVWQNEERRATH